jgi:hypothetical protein
MITTCKSEFAFEGVYGREAIPSRGLFFLGKVQRRSEPAGRSTHSVRTWRFNSKMVTEQLGSSIESHMRSPRSSRKALHAARLRSAPSESSPTDLATYPSATEEGCMIGADGCASSTSPRDHLQRLQRCGVGMARPPAWMPFMARSAA